MKRCFFVLILILLIPTTSFARNWKVGLMVGGGFSSVDDPEGSTERLNHLSLINGISTIPFGRDRRIFTHIFYNDFDLTIKKNKVSSSVRSLGLNTSLQWMIRGIGFWKPWIGAGIGFSQDSFTDRRKFDRDALILERFSDREDKAVNFLLNASSKLTTWKNLDLGAHAQIDLPISGDITRFIFFGTVLF